MAIGGGVGQRQWKLMGLKKGSTSGELGIERV